MQLTYYGHSCFGFSFGGKNIIVDPFISPNPQAKDIDINAIKADYILLTHGHGDHIADVPKIAQNNESTIVSIYEIASYYEQKGFKTIGGNIGGIIPIGDGQVRMVTAVHSSVMPDGTHAGNAMGFLFQSAEKRFYFAGDTALTMDMKLIPYYEDQLDFSVFPVGGHFTMDYKDAVLACDFVRCQKIIGCHFNTFPPISIDVDAAEEYLTDRNIDVTLPKIGDVINM